MSSNYRQAYLLSSGLPDHPQLQSGQRTGNRQSSSSSSSSSSSRQDQQREVELHQAMAECHLSGLPGLEAANEQLRRAHSNRRQPEANSGQHNVRQIKLQFPMAEPTNSDYLRSSCHSGQSHRQSNRRLHSNFLDPNNLRHREHNQQQVADAQVSQSTFNGENSGQYRTRRDSSPTTTSSLPRQQPNSSSVNVNNNNNNNNNNNLQHLQMAATKQQERRHLADFGPVTSGATTTSGRQPSEQFGDLGDYRRAQQTADRRGGPTMSDQGEYARELRRTSQRHHQDHYASQSSSSFNYNQQTNQATCTIQQQQQQQQQPRASAIKATNLHVNFNRSSQKNCNGKLINGQQQQQQQEDDGQQDDEGEGENTRKKKYLTAKYGQQQMNLIKKRLKIEMWLYEQLQELAKRTNSEGELDEIDIDLDQLLDMEDDQTRRHWLQKTLQPFSSTAGQDQPDERIATFIEEILGQSKLL